jgi:hypothetical protein
MTEIGETVLVFEPDDPKKFIGKGTYLGVEQIDVEEDKSDKIVTSFESPKIKLENGRIIYGFECWWAPEDTNKEESSGSR